MDYISIIKLTAEQIIVNTKYRRKRIFFINEIIFQLKEKFIKACSKTTEYKSDQKESAKKLYDTDHLQVLNKFLYIFNIYSEYKEYSCKEEHLYSLWCESKLLREEKQVNDSLEKINKIPIILNYNKHYIPFILCDSEKKMQSFINNFANPLSADIKYDINEEIHGKENPIRITEELEYTELNSDDRDSIKEIYLLTEDNKEEKTYLILTEQAHEILEHSAKKIKPVDDEAVVESEILWHSEINDLNQRDAGSEIDLTLIDIESSESSIIFFEDEITEALSKFTDFLYEAEADDEDNIQLLVNLTPIAQNRPSMSIDEELQLSVRTEKNQLRQKLPRSEEKLKNTEIKNFFNKNIIYEHSTMFKHERTESSESSIIFFENEIMGFFAIDAELRHNIQYEDESCFYLHMPQTEIFTTLDQNQGSLLIDAEAQLNMQYKKLVEEQGDTKEHNIEIQFIKHLANLLHQFSDQQNEYNFLASLNFLYKLISDLIVKYSESALNFENYVNIIYHNLCSINYTLKNAVIDFNQQEEEIRQYLAQLTEHNEQKVALCYKEILAAIEGEIELQFQAAKVQYNQSIVLFKNNLPVPKIYKTQQDVFNAMDHAKGEYYEKEQFFKDVKDKIRDFYIANCAVDFKYFDYINYETLQEKLNYLTQNRNPERCQFSERYLCLSNRPKNSYEAALYEYLINIIGANDEVKYTLFEHNEYNFSFNANVQNICFHLLNIHNECIGIINDTISYIDSELADFSQEI